MNVHEFHCNALTFHYLTIVARSRRLSSFFLSQKTNLVNRVHCDLGNLFSISAVLICLFEARTGSLLPLFFSQFHSVVHIGISFKICLLEFNSAY